MTSTTDPQLVTAAEAARLLGVTRQRILELAASTTDFPPAERTSTGGRVWPRMAVQAWAATHPDPGPVFTGPSVPLDAGHPPQIWQVLNRAAHEAQELNHPWIGDDHLVLGLLHSDCPGVARRVLESFGIRRDPFRQAFITSMGDPWDTKPTHTTLSPATQLTLERANLEAARLADAEVTSEHVLLALIGHGPFPTGWATRSGITAETVRQRVIDATEGVVLPEPPDQLPSASPYGLGSEDTLDLAPNPLGHDPRRGAPGAPEASGSRWTGHPRRGCWDASTSSTGTAIPC